MVGSGPQIPHRLSSNCHLSSSSCARCLCLQCKTKNHAVQYVTESRNSVSNIGKLPDSLLRGELGSFPF